jgi:hypothetical protein
VLADQAIMTELFKEGARVGLPTPTRLTHEANNTVL